MSTTTSELLRSFFFSGGEAPAGNISIDVLDSWTNAGMAAVAPTTISWSDARGTGDPIAS